MADVERDAKLDVLRSIRAVLAKRSQCHVEMPISHSEIRQYLIDSARQSLGASCSELTQLGRRLGQRAACGAFPRLELSNVESRRIDEIELDSRLNSRLNDARQRSAVLLRQ